MQFVLYVYVRVPFFFVGAWKMTDMGKQRLEYKWVFFEAFLARKISTVLFMKSNRTGRMGGSVFFSLGRMYFLSDDRFFFSFVHAEIYDDGKLICFKIWFIFFKNIFIISIGIIKMFIFNFMRYSNPAK